jgi:hypothetical protein
MASLQEVHQEFAKRFVMTPVLYGALDTLFAIITAHRLCLKAKEPSTWAQFNAPPGDFKTGMMNSTMGVPEMLQVDSSSSAGLVSGYIDPNDPDAPDPSLMAMLDTRIMQIHDLSTFVSRQQEIPVVMNTLRGAYDGTINRNFGNKPGITTHRCRFAVVLGTVPSQWQITNEQRNLGERFIHYAWASSNRMQVARYVSERNVSPVDDRLREDVAGMLSDKPGNHSIADFTRTKDFLVGLARLADLCAMVRGAGVGSTRIIVPYCPEMPGRISLQLTHLAMGLAYNADYDTRLEWHQWENLLVYICKSSVMPCTRRALAEFWIAGEGLTCEQLGRQIHDNYRAAQIIRDLSGVELDDEHGGGMMLVRETSCENSTLVKWAFSDAARALFLDTGWFPEKGRRVLRIM